MPWLGVVAVAAAVLGFVVLMIGVWIVVAGDRASAMVDEPSTLDVQNHIGDSRPVR